MQRTLGTDLDERGKGLWNQSYVLVKERNLWGDPPVPFTQDAIDLFAAGEASVVLDFPCGDGRNLPPLAAAFGTVVGADSSPNALAIARHLADASGLKNIVLAENDIFASTFVDESFDGVFCCDVLGHLTQPAQALGELLRICRPGCCVVANVFALEDSTRGVNMTSIGTEEYVFDNRFYFRFYDRGAVTGLLAQIDAELVWLKAVSWHEPPHEGYREYPHEHASWLFALRKRQ